MKQMNRLVVMAGVAACLCLGSNELAAQGRPRGGGPPGGGPGGGPGGRGNFDPAQMRERMMERLREVFEVKDDAEWKIIEERVTKVYEVQREAAGSRFGGMGMLFGRGPGGGGQENQQDSSSRGRSRFGGTPSADAEALQKAIDGKASNEQLKQRMERVRESRKAAEAKLVEAQEDLKQVLNVRQEAVALQMGLVN